MNIFENDHEILQIGALTIENTKDSIIISGDVQIDKTPTGKAQAQALYDFAQVLVNTFHQLEKVEGLEGQVPAQERVPTNIMVDNPFA